MDRKRKFLEKFISDISFQLERLKGFLTENGFEPYSFEFSLNEIDSVEKIIRDNYKKDETILEALKVYIGEAFLFWGGGEWIYYESKSPSMAMYNKKFGITKIESGKYKGYLPDFLPDSAIKHKILANAYPESISKVIDINTSWSKKRINKG